jgi:hypothetical protein
MPKYDELLKECEAYAGSADGIQPLMQHVAQRLHEGMARYNWVGFCLMELSPSKALVLGPYAGSFVPTLRIPLDKGCTVVVNNIVSDPRYIGSDIVKIEYCGADLLEETGGGRTGCRKPLCGHLHCAMAELHRVLRRPSRAVHGSRRGLGLILATDN